MLQLFNSMGHKIEPFVPQDPANVWIHICGPTVYSYAHIGNTRTAVVFDVLARMLRYHFPKHIYASYPTNVDDKITVAARAEGMSCDEITLRFTVAYHADLAALGVAPQDSQPLLNSDHAYAADGHILFYIPSFLAYGRLSGADPNEMLAGARVEVAPSKRDPGDFVLWKPSKIGQQGWDSPWGFGRPGWHIACSAMIRDHLGEQINIYGDGIDLRVPHHENEIAQSTKARFWIHNGHVTVSSAKVSKSLGNVLLVRDLLAEITGKVIRCALLSAYYRQPLDWTPKTPKAARATLDRLYGAFHNQPDAMVRAEDTMSVQTALGDDINTPAALAALHALAWQVYATTDPGRKAELVAALKQSADMLGLLRQEATTWGQLGAVVTPRIEALVAKRAEARAARDWSRSDTLREELVELDVEVEDAGGESRWGVRT